MIIIRKKLYHQITNLNTNSLYTISGNYIHLIRESPRGVMVKVLDWCLEVSKFEFQWCYNVYFRTNSFREDMSGLITQAVLNNTSTVFLQR